MRIVVGDKIKLRRLQQGETASSEEVEGYAQEYVAELQRLVSAVDPGGKLNVII